ncbi:MAG: cytochrome c family protein [Deltaproteobacteria bacterium]|nr:cytochrome c family protein [Deltaproteobacteria bacterium]MDL1960632.1 cytochrome c family protein [Deltaproteobacteria bacterium]
MKSSKVISMVVAVCFGLVMAGVAMATDKGPETITMDSKVFAKHKKSLVIFNHAKHNVDYKIACTECHHVYKDGKNVWKEGDAVQKCDACHTGAKAPKEPKLSKEEQIKGYMYSAIHENCKSCHKAAKKEGKAAPTKCTECHPKAAK